MIADKETPAAAVPVETILVPAATPAMTKEAIKHLLMGKPAPKTPVETVLVPAAIQTTPPVVVSGQSAKWMPVWTRF